MIRLNVKRATAAVVLLLLIVTGNAWGEILYTVTDLGVLPGHVEALGVNAWGQVVGGGYGINSSHAFLYSGGSVTDLGSLSANKSYAFGINNNGQIAGSAENTSGDARAFLWQSGSGMQEIGTLGGTQSAAQGINEAGQIAGYAYTADGHKHAFLYSGGTMADLGTLHGGASGAYGINNAGQVVGWSWRTSSSNNWTAFLYSDETMIDLSAFPHSPDSIRNPFVASNFLITLHVRPSE